VVSSLMVDEVVARKITFDWNIGLRDSEEDRCCWPGRRWRGLVNVESEDVRVCLISLNPFVRPARAMSSALLNG
jgi:hypothetical protein